MDRCFCFCSTNTMLCIMIFRQNLGGAGLTAASIRIAEKSLRFPIGHKKKAKKRNLHNTVARTRQAAAAAATKND